MSRRSGSAGTGASRVLDDIGPLLTRDSALEQPPKTEPRWWTVVPESLVGLAAITALDIAFWRFGQLTTIELQLYWVFVLLQSVRRGLRAGLIVALLAAGAYAALAIGVPGAMPSSYERLSTETFFVLLVAMIAGDLRERWRGRERRLVSRTAELSDALDDLSKEYASASEVIAELGRRIAEQTVTVATLDDISRRLDVLESAGVLPALLQLLVHALRVERASVFLLEDGHLVLKAHLPHSEYMPANESLIDNELVREALASRASRHIRSKPAGRAESLFATAPVLMAAPLLGPLGQPIGVVTVEQMAFLAFNRSAVRFFEILVAWASRTFQNALLFERVSSARATNDNEEGSVLTFPPLYALKAPSIGSRSRGAGAISRRFAPAARLMRTRGVNRLTFAAYGTRSRWSRRLRRIDSSADRSTSTDAAL